MNVELAISKIVRLYKEERARMRDDAASQEIARKNVMLVASSETQAPLATYHPGTQSEFDLRKLAPGTVFRVNDTSPEIPNDPFTWYVTGNKKGQLCDIFQIGHEDEAEDFSYSFKETLKLGESWDLYTCEVSNMHFPVDEFNDVIKPIYELHNDPTLEPLTVEKIDIMHSGKTRRSQIPQSFHGEFQLLPILLPEPVKARI